MDFVLNVDHASGCGPKQCLDGDLAIEREFSAGENAPHAALGDLGGDLVASNRRPIAGRRGLRC
jgi:hypothetical protein